ncbi:MAG TPA: hypothetical protein VFB68_16510 [Xanthobacteraceae bacterium]|nr:hypothetical protein [Xanthobacteraceae bacterium]
MSNFENVFLTYADDIGTDGVGAQLHRIYGIYCLSRLLGTKYLHSPIGRCDYQGMDAFQNQEKDPTFVDSFNRRFTLPSDRPTMPSPSEVTLPVLPNGRVERALGLRYGGRRKQLSPIRLSKFGRIVAGLSKRNAETVVRIGSPHALMDRYASGYEVCKSLSPFKTSMPNKVLRIALHVRRGELIFVNSERLIDNRYYVNIAHRLAAALESAQIPFELELHSELLQKESMVRPDDPAFRGRIDEVLQLRPEQDPFQDFDVFPRLTRFINEPTMTCIERLATADILVTSKSSFSYLAAILNVDGIVLYHPFWHYPPDSWLVTKPSGEFDVQRFMRQMQRLRKVSQ